MGNKKLTGTLIPKDNKKAKMHATFYSDKPIGGGGDSEIFDEYIDATDQQRNTALANVSNQTANSTTGKMGYKVLDATKTFASQVTAENTIYEIRDVFDLGGTQETPVSVIIQNNCVLEFNGGSIKNGTIQLSNNCSINGNGCVLKASLDTDTMTSNTIISIENATNILIQDVVFDGGFNNIGTPSNSYEGNTLISVRDSSNIILKDCIIQNWWQSWKSSSISHYIGFSVAYFYNSDKVTIDNVSLYNIRPESPTFDTCTNVTINGYNIYGASSGMWTGLHFLYCENIVLENSCIYVNENQGSTINCIAKNVILRDCYFEGGRGLDFSNETGIAFDISNIFVYDCIMKNTKCAIETYPINSENNIDKITVDNLSFTTIYYDDYSYFAFDVRYVDSFILRNSVISGKKYLLNLGSNNTEDIEATIEDNIIENASDNVLEALIRTTLTTGNTINIGNLSFKNNKITSNCLLNIADTVFNWKLIVFEGNNIKTTSDAIRPFTIDNNSNVVDVVFDNNIFNGNINQANKIANNSCLVSNNYMYGKLLFLLGVNLTVFENNKVFSTNNIVFPGTGDSIVRFNNNYMPSMTIFINTELPDGKNIQINNNTTNFRTTQSGSLRNKWIHSVYKYGNNNFGLPETGPTTGTGDANKLPLTYIIGKSFFDETNNKPIWWNGTGWIDLTGTTVYP